MFPSPSEILKPTASNLSDNTNASALSSRQMNLGVLLSVGVKNLEKEASFASLGVLEAFIRSRASIDDLRDDVSYLMDIPQEFRACMKERKKAFAAAAIV